MAFDPEKYLELIEHFFCFENFFIKKLQKKERQKFIFCSIGQIRKKYRNEQKILTLVKKKQSENSSKIAFFCVKVFTIYKRQTFGENV